MSADREVLFDGPRRASTTIALAHGAGAGMDSPFLTFFATKLGDRDYRVARFEFPYIASQRLTGKKKPAAARSGDVSCSAEWARVPQDTSWRLREYQCKMPAPQYLQGSNRRAQRYLI